MKRTVWVPVMYGILVEEAEDNDVAENAARQLVMDLLEENWDETFQYDDVVMDFIGFEWLNGMFTQEDRVSEVDDDNEEETQGGSSEAG